MMRDVHRALSHALDRLTALEGRLERMHRKGTVAMVDDQKHRIRMKIGGTDEQPHMSPWIPYVQHAGSRSEHSMPSMGQQMLMVSPDGDFEQAHAVPLIWSNNNPSPSKDKDTHVDKITMSPSSGSASGSSGSGGSSGSSGGSPSSNGGSGDSNSKSTTITRKGDSHMLDCATHAVNAETSITLTAPNIYLIGNVFLGSKDASRELALRDSVDSAGDVEVSNLSTKVKAV